MLDERPGGDYRVFETRRIAAAHPVTGETRDFSIIRAPDWVNIIALTADMHVVMVRQHRHGVGRQTLEIPGGMVDPGEHHSAAAARELREETGFAADEWLELGVVEPNPALQTNRCFTWLAVDAYRAGELALDPGEVLEVEHHPLADIAAMIQQQTITHALVVAAFLHFVNHHGGWQYTAATSSARR